MKLKEKLAEEFGYNNNPISSEKAIPLEKAYIAGFEKSREIDAQLIRDLYEALHSIKGKPTIRDLIRLRSRIECQGEEEV